MKTLCAIVSVLALLATSGLAQPTITQVQNAASNAVQLDASSCQCSALPNSAIAQGSYFSIYGTGIGPSTFAFWGSYPFQSTLSNTSVSVTVGGTTVAAIPEFVYSTQINAVLPSNTPTGTGTVTVTFNGATSNAFNITVGPSSFGTFSINEAGSGPGIITDTNYVTLSPFHTAKPGDYVFLWGTGLGPVADSSSEFTGPPTQTNLCADASSCPVTVWVGGLKANVQYAGRASYTAEDQIVFIVPQGVQGCYVQVALQTGSGSSAIVGNTTSMPVDPNGATCQDADGINYNDIASVVSSKGSANVLAVSMLSNYLSLNLGPLLGTQQWDNDTISGQIDKFSAYTLSAFQGFFLGPSASTATAPNCSVSEFFQYPPPSDPATAAATFLDAGTALSISGQNGTVNVGTDLNSDGKTVGYGGAHGGDPIGGETIGELIAGCPSTSKNGCAPYFLNDTGWGTSSWTWSIVPGTYTVTAPGGADVGAVSGSIAVSSAAANFKWTNQSTLAASPISRSTPLTITWSGDTDPNGFVDITAISSTLQSGQTPAASTPGILVECIAPASAGTFTIPTYVLQSLPSTAGSTSLVPPGELLVGPASAVTKMTTPSGLDAAYIFYHFIEGQNVSWQ